MTASVRKQLEAQPNIWKRDLSCRLKFPLRLVPRSRIRRPLPISAVCLQFPQAPCLALMSITSTRLCDWHHGLRCAYEARGGPMKKTRPRRQHVNNGRPSTSPIQGSFKGHVHAARYSLQAQRGIGDRQPRGCSSVHGRRLHASSFASTVRPFH